MGREGRQLSERLERALAAIDRANQDDPHTLDVRGAKRPKELAHAELMSEWVGQLWRTANGEAPSEALQLAARAHHIRRWTLPRSDYPEGTHGYRRWRIDLQKFHAAEAARILGEAGYDDATIERVQAILQKKGLRSDPEVQTYEDALCIVFVETQLAALADKTEEEKMVEIIRKTLRKMSPAGIEAAQGIPLDERCAALLARAASGN